MSLIQHFVVFAVLILLLMSASSCMTKHSAKLFDKKSEASLWIKDRGDIRHVYIMHGDDRKGYLKLDISKIYSPADGIFVCWQNEVNKLEIIVPHAKFLAGNIDTVKYEYLSEIPFNHEGLPNVQKYHSDQCFEFHLPSRTVFPEGRAIVK